jgi:hypothetical protein
MGIDDARAIAQAIVDTIRGPLLVFDKDLRVVTQTVQQHLQTSEPGTTIELGPYLSRAV